jgi:hypothetical protein
MPNVWLKDIIPSVLVLLDLLETHLTGVSWTKAHPLHLILAIPALVDQTQFALFWMGEQSVTV